MANVLGTKRITHNPNPAIGKENRNKQEKKKKKKEKKKNKMVFKKINSRLKKRRGKKGKQNEERMYDTDTHRRKNKVGGIQKYVFTFSRRPASA